MEKVDCLIQVVDDGSPSDEVISLHEIIDPLHLRFPERIAPLLALPFNQGKGAAIQAGWRAHQNFNLLAFVDADGAVAPYEVYRLAEMSLKSTNRAYFGSRIRMLGKTVTRSLTRHLVGRVFASLVSVKLNIAIYDSQCGLKFIPSKAFWDHITLFQEKGFAFDLELVVALIEGQYVIEEIPIDWTHIPGSKVSYLRDAFRMYLSLTQIANRRHLWILKNNTK